jgi:hypothetical protein
MARRAATMASRLMVPGQHHAAWAARRACRFRARSARGPCPSNIAASTTASDSGPAVLAVGFRQHHQIGIARASRATMIVDRPQLRHRRIEADQRRSAPCAASAAFTAPFHVGSGPHARPVPWRPASPPRPNPHRNSRSGCDPPPAPAYRGGHPSPGQSRRRPHRRRCDMTPSGGDRRNAEKRLVGHGCLLRFPCAPTIASVPPSLSLIDQGQVEARARLDADHCAGWRADTSKRRDWSKTPSGGESPVAPGPDTRDEGTQNVGLR